MNYKDVSLARMSFVAYERRVSIVLDRRSMSLVGMDLDDIRSGSAAVGLALLAN